MLTKTFWILSSILVLASAVTASPCGGDDCAKGQTAGATLVACSAPADRITWGAPDAGGPSQPTPAATSEASFPDGPRVRLADVGGSVGSDEHVKAMAFRVDELIKRGQEAAEPAERVEAQLAAANLILSHQLEPACTRRLLGIFVESTPSEQAALRDLLLRVDKLLNESDDILEALAERQSELPEDWLSLAQHRHATLRSFTAGLRAFLLPPEGDERHEEMKRVAYGLAPLREDPNRLVAASASLWQACLRSAGDDVSRAVAVLEPALADPVPETMPYAFFGRLLHCRLTAQRGAYAAAIALLMQIEERCMDWLSDATDQANAIRAAQLVRFQIMADWHKRLTETGSESERAWCVDRAAELRRNHFDDENDTVFRLGLAVPMVAPEPPPPEDRPGSASEGG